MGTASLVMGIVLIGFAFYAIIEILNIRSSSNTQFEVDSLARLIMILILPVPLIVVGGLLLRKYDRDKKKSQSSSTSSSSSSSGQ